jgi:hypothetical protein
LTMEPDEEGQKTSEAPQADKDLDHSPDNAQAVDPEEAKRLAMRKRKPLGPVMKPMTKEQIEALLKDPEAAERDNLLDAMPKGAAADDQDSF